MLFSPSSSGSEPATGQNRSRQLGLEIFALAGFAAIIPVLAVAAIVFWQAERSLTEQARTALAHDAATYAQDVERRLIDVSRRFDADELVSGGLIADYAIIDASDRQRGGNLRVPPGVLAQFSDDQLRLTADFSTPIPTLYVGRRGNATATIGQLDAAALWSTPTFDGFACVFLGASPVPLHCSAATPQDAIGSLRDQAASEMREIEYGEDQQLLSSALEISANSVIAMQPARAIVGRSTQTAYAAISELRGMYLPVLGVAVVLSLLGSLLYSRRILYPLVRMLNVTRELTRRDIWGRADLRKRDHFHNVAHDLQHMADDLAQQFNARETLSQIDQAILAGTDTTQVVELVLQHMVESVSCRRAMITMLDDDDELRASIAMMSRGHPVVRSGSVNLDAESRGWLERNSDGVTVSVSAKGTPAEPFVGQDTPHTYVLPILVQGSPAAAVSIMSMKESVGANELQKGHVRDLAGRLAVALEVVSRSEELQRKAYFDDLTGLPNRDFCFERLDNAIRQAKNLESAVAVMFIDLDGFKAINDSLGHIAGDELIRQAAYRLSRCVGESGTIGRLGGDEFAVVLPFPIDSALPEELAERVLREISEPFQISTSEIHLSASVGVARYPHDGDSRVELLRKADTAMYGAKEAGRGRKIDYSNTMGIKVDERMRLEAELRYALDNDELQVFYQPQLDMKSGLITSAEALIRWNHPERGLVLPGEFVHIAEDSGYINVLGGWIMSAACRQLSRWKDQGLPIDRISVNVSAGQFRRTDFLDVVESSLYELQFAAGALEIELTERVFVEDITQARRTLERLKELGVVVSIDDFGTGYSSLGYLKHLTFDAVKVDQSFVHELPGNRESEAIVRSVLAMCHTLGKQVVAEGIETDEQFRFLRQAGVDIGQGYRIGRPMNAENFAAYVREAERRAAHPRFSLSLEKKFPA